jgi:phospholipid/cholesterol/gamma-HCH transport system substrate-binding protein
MKAITWRSALAVVLIAAVAVAAGLVIRQTFFAPKRITAIFTTATSIYPGDEVRVAGVRVGTIAGIQPEGTQAKVTLDVDHDVPIPADAKAVIVAQNLVAARYVQLTPAYISNGPTMADGAVIPVDRTAVPVEWDEVKTQLMRLATDLGPKSDVSGTSVSRFIESTANAMDGNGDKLRQTLAQLSGVGRILADGSGNITEIVANLQTFVTALRDSNVQIVAFQDRLASLSSVLDGGRSDLDAALTNLSSAVGEVQRFIAGSRNQTSEQVQRLANVTQNLVDHRIDLENVLHLAPNAFANGYNVYNPDTGDAVGGFVFNNFSNPVQFICAAIGSVENVTAVETGKLCEQYLGPALKLLNFNYIPFPINPYLMKSADPDHIIYADPALAPGGQGPPPGPPEQPPSVSAYAGLATDPYPAPADVPPPAVAPWPSAPDHLPATPSPALLPGAPIPGPPQIATPAPSAPGLQGLMLPADAPPPPASPSPGPPLPAEGTPPS